MQLFVGTTALLGKVERYAERFQILELRADPARLPHAKALRKLRSAAPSKLAFSLLVPAALTGPLLQGSASLDFVRDAADALAARWIVLQTGPEVGSSARARGRLQTLAAALRIEGRRIAWEPRGPWEPEVAREAAQALDLTLVEDLSVVESAPMPLVYTRLRSVGPGAQLRMSALERLAEQIAGAEEAYVLIEGQPSPKAKARIEQAIKSVLEAEDDTEEHGFATNGLAAFPADDEEDDDEEELGADADADDEEEEEDEDDDQDDDDDDLEGEAPPGDDLDEDDDDDDDDLDDDAEAPKKGSKKGQS
ncbi:MAG TPA: DUF72 domain-containing protein [Polyangiaceae bacterium]|nr:DUF72 domain-containing protein [Polyangiaceae bacterium]